MINNYIRRTGTRQVLRLSSQGRVTQVIYSCVGCKDNGLLILGGHLYIVHQNGNVIETRVSDGLTVRRSTIPGVALVSNTGSLYSNPDEIPDKQTLLLCDWKKGEVFTFKPATRQKQLRITGLRNPNSVSYYFSNQIVFYIVSEEGRSRINVYNQAWHLIRTLGTQGELSKPISAIVSDDDTIIISDYNNGHVSEFSLTGTFLRHLLVRADGINSPGSMSYHYPHLWLVDGFPNGKLYRYKL